MLLPTSNREISMSVNTRTRITFHLNLDYLILMSAKSQIVKTFTLVVTRSIYFHAKGFHTHKYTRSDIMEMKVRKFIVFTSYKQNLIV